MGMQVERKVENIILEQVDDLLITKPFRGIWFNVGEQAWLAVGSGSRGKKYKLIHKDAFAWTWRLLK